ncbi:MAG: LPS export ABC transporter periplasmic protein LptC [Acidobacteriota bacterium]|nr:LPS export ABC transporter periplasmic protein LptC [Acidobacteriota bacterium]
MRPRVAYLVAAAAVLLSVGVVWMATRRPETPAGDDSAKPAATKKPDDIERIQVEFEGLKLNEFDDQGKLLWQVKSRGSIAFDRETMRATGTDILWELARSAEEKLEVRAKQFVIDMKDRAVRFTDGVEAKSTVAGASFACDGLHYNMDTQVLEASGPVTATYAGYDLKSGKLVAERASDTIRLSDKVTLQYQGYSVKCGQATVDSDTSVATLTDSPTLDGHGYHARTEKAVLRRKEGRLDLSGGVKVTHEDLTATAPRAKATNDGKNWELSGGVTLKGKGVTASAPKLIIDAKSGTATFLGKVRAQARVPR